MAELRRAYGTVLVALVLGLVATWVLALIVGPQISMVDQSLWRWERSPAAAQAKIDEDRLYNDLSLAQYDLKSAAAARRPALQAKIAVLKSRLAALSKVNVAPRKVYTVANYTEMTGYHARIFLKTILASLAVALISFLVCYPVAYAAATAGRPGRAALILLLLVIPYAINELLRVFAWLMILDYHGLANLLVEALGGRPIRFLDTDFGVFVAMVYAYVLFMVFPLYNTLETLDRNQIDAARGLGASTWRIHARVVLPHAKPGIAVGAIMTFMLSAGSFSVPAIMTRGTAPPWFSQLIYSKFFDADSWHQGAAYAFTLLAVCVLFILLMMALFRVGIRDIAK
jgi:spermidine/putrescine transport system permease protein